MAKPKVAPFQASTRLKGSLRVTPSATSASDIVIFHSSYESHNHKKLALSPSYRELLPTLETVHARSPHLFRAHLSESRGTSATADSEKMSIFEFDDMAIGDAGGTTPAADASRSPHATRHRSASASRGAPRLVAVEAEHLSVYGRTLSGKALRGDVGDGGGSSRSTASTRVKAGSRASVKAGSRASVKAGSRASLDAVSRTALRAGADAEAMVAAAAVSGRLKAAEPPDTGVLETTTTALTSATGLTTGTFDSEDTDSSSGTSDEEDDEEDEAERRGGKKKRRKPTLHLGEKRAGCIPRGSCGFPHLERDHPCEVIPYLLLGGKETAGNRELLLSLGVTHIVNVTTTVPCHFPADFSYMNVKIADAEATDIAPHFNGVVDFVHAAIDRRHPTYVYVHCVAGVSRSVSMVAAYLMHHRKMRLKEAMTLISSKRRIAWPNKSFCYALAMLETDLFNGETSVGKERQGSMFDFALWRRQRRAFAHAPTRPCGSCVIC